MKKNPFYSILLIFFGLAIGSALAEVIAHFYLPVPIANKLPLIRLEADRFCGYKFRPNQVGYRVSGKITVNRWGFRGKDWTLEKAPDVMRLVLLGDSYGEGYGVGDEETVGAQLENILNLRTHGNKHYEVLNFSVGGYDLGHEIKALQHHALQFRPDFVLILFFLNDLLYVKDYSGYPRLFVDTERTFSLWKWKVRELCRRSRLLMTAWDWWHSITPDPMNEVMRAYVDEDLMPPTGPGRDGWEFVVTQLRQFQFLALENRFKPILVIIPTPQEIVNRKKGVAYQNFLIKQCRAMDIVPVTLLSDFCHDGIDWMRLFIPYDWHFTKEGHRLVAESLSRVIEIYYPLRAN